MGWLDRVNTKKEEDKLPPRLRDKTPEQIAQELDDADKLKNDLELSKAAQRDSDAKVAEIQSEFDKVKERLAAADASRNKPDNRDNKVDVTPENMLENPKGVLDSRLGPLEAVTIQNAASTSRILAQQQLDNLDSSSGGKSMDGRLFRAWGSEIDSESRKYAAIQLIKPEAWLGIFYYLKGVHSDELRDPEIRKKKYNFLEPSTSGAPGPDNSIKKDGPEGLTDAEKHVADKMGVSYENYAKRKKSMQFVSA